MSLEGASHSTKHKTGEALTLVVGGLVKEKEQISCEKRQMVDQAAEACSLGVWKHLILRELSQQSRDRGLWGDRGSTDHNLLWKPNAFEQIGRFN